ncbi:MAG: DUF2157 domain-containing protein [Bacteroidetes bacterium]|nr:DUF2157 domain-containing protein [Bacteroidota bacterium]MBS1539453.1 DUF2157 domain-containing protein [Bacteroidota bacterium]
MQADTLRELRAKGLITDAQLERVEAVRSRKVFSVFYELQTLLYLGVLLFSTGIGLLIYQHIGQLGHYASLFLLGATTVGCFYYAFKKGNPYVHTAIQSPTPYFDYVVLLGCLLFVSVLGYAQFLFGFLNESIQEVTLLTAVIFFFMAYRFDHAGVLSLAIVALASFWGLRVSLPQWRSSEIFDQAHLRMAALIFGIIVSLIAVVLDKMKIKTHFTFTYFNFCCLIFFTGAVAGIFNSSNNNIYILSTYIGCGGAVYFAFQKKSFLFLLYAFVAGYIATTDLAIEWIMKSLLLISLYLIGSCVGLVWFIIRYKNFFKRHE